MIRGNGIVGVVREVKNKWERRAPLSPVNVKNLVDQGIKVLIQPCNRRVYTDKEYEIAGATIAEDLTPASVILAVKEVPINKLIPNRTYMFFSHTIKAQAYNMPLLDAILAKNIRMIDYECIVDGGVRGNRRLVAFGRYAGIAGMVDTFSGLGQRLLALGYGTPFLHVSQTYMYKDLDAVMVGVDQVGRLIKEVGTPKALGPMTYVFTGVGNVSQGAQEIFKRMPHEMVAPADLPSVVAAGSSADLNKLYGCVVTPEHMVKHTEGRAFNKRHYYEYPEEYTPIFHETIAPYTSVLMNCMYWEPEYPRILSNAQQRELMDKKRSRLLAVGDITCDPLGSVEFLSRSTTIEDPFFLADVEAGVEHSGLDDHGIMMLGVENLPAQMPRDATNYFGEKLRDYIPLLARSDGTLPFDRQTKDLPIELHGAVIADKGQLTPNFAYIAKMRQDKERLNELTASRKVSGEFKKLLVIRGHLFDSNLINNILDILIDKETGGVGFRVADWIVGGSREEKTTAILELQGEEKTVALAVKSVENLISAMGRIADATVRELPFGSTPLTPSSTSKTAGTPAVAATASGPAVIGGNLPKQSVLILGSGMVSQPLLDYLYRMPNLKINLASNNLEEAQRRAAGRERIHPTKLDAVSESARVDSMVKENDLVISMLPAPFHIEVAQRCIANRKNMITASYASPAMKALHEKAKEAGVVILNELGLDPGIDHMSAMKMIDEIHGEGGKVDSFLSLCGGLPAPEASNNPLGYKFSWSPRGVLMAGLNDARYLVEGRTVNVDGKNLFNSAKPIQLVGPSLSLEHLPNRDSLPYLTAYGIPEAKTVYRGTLRYKGFSEIMSAFRSLGMFELDPSINSQHDTWGQFMRALIPGKTDNVAASLVKLFHFSTGSMDSAVRIVKAVEFLGLLSDSTAYPKNTAPLDALCALLQRKLAYSQGERDLVLMHHKLEFTRTDGSRACTTATMQAYGVPHGDTAMSSTVALPVAIAASLMLQGKLNLNSPDLCGIRIPTIPGIYNPILEILDKEGISLSEVTEPLTSRTLEL